MRQPVDRVADHLHVRHGRRDPRPDPVDQRRQPGRLGRRLGRRRAQARRRRHHRRQVQRPGRTPAIPIVGRVRRVPAHALAHHQHADARRAAPLVRAGVSTDQPAGTGTRPTDWAASTYSGTPASAHAAAAAATGCTVPTSWLALISAASATPGAATARRPGGQVEPAEPVHRHRRRRAAAATCRSAACSTAECSIAECTSVAPGPAPPGQAAERRRRAPPPYRWP